MTNTVTQTDSRSSVASNFRVGGNLVANTQGTFTVQGSNLAVAGNADHFILAALEVAVAAGCGFIHVARPR